VAKLLKKSEQIMGHSAKKRNIWYVKTTFTFLLSIVSLIPVYSLLPLPAKNPKDKWVIVIDPGHGGSDSGALGLTSKEKDITLAVSLLTGKYLKQNLDNVEVIYTREDDSSVDLLERPKIANRNNADLFISIHANSVADNKLKNHVSGTETYIMGLAKDKASLEVAMIENKVITLEEDYSTKYAGFDPQSPESYIIFTLTHNLYQEQSTNLASMIQDQFRERVGRKDRGVKQAGYWVLYNTTMPSVLVEIGFICNPAEEKFISSKEGQEYLASAIFRACRDYINEIDSKSSISIQERVNSSVNSADDNATPSTSQPEEIIFRVQIATTSTRKEINPSNFKGYTNVYEITDNDRYKYSVGSFDSYSDAVAYRKKVENDYPDAFVIAIKDNKVLPLQQALEMR
jgi:N-acetylmuramoyl-L-alanine amidase